MKKKRKKLGYLDDLAIPFTVAGGAVGMGIIGGALDSKIPAGMSNPLTSGGTTLGKFVSPITTISASGIIFKELNKTKKKLKY